MPPMVVLQKIKAPVEDVFNFVGNVTTHPQFADFCREVKITSEHSTGVGTRFHQVYEDSRECDSEIMVWEPFQKIVWHNFEGEEKPAQIVTYRFEQEDEITHVLHIVETDAYENQALHRKGTEENLREMANLKRIMEEARDVSP